MASTEVPLSSVKSASELAELLKVDIKALYCSDIIRPVVSCGLEGCIFPALARNKQCGRHGSGPRCAVHRQNSFPTNM